MKKYLEITKIEYLDDYTLLVTFNEKQVERINFKSLIFDKKSVFNVLKDKNEFKKYKIDMAGGLAWNCGLDLAPDMLFNEIKRKIS
jgi:hypothetical protein